MQPMQPLQPGCIEKEKIRHRQVMKALIRAGFVFVMRTRKCANPLYINDFGIRKKNSYIVSI